MDPELILILSLAGVWMFFEIRKTIKDRLDRAYIDKFFKKNKDFEDKFGNHIKRKVFEENPPLVAQFVVYMMRYNAFRRFNARV